MRRAWLLVPVLAVAGCGGSGDGDASRYRLTTPAPDRGALEAVPTIDPTATPAPTPRPRPGELEPTHADAKRLGRIIAAWADTLRGGDVNGAARLFNVPVIVAQSRGAVTLTARDQIRVFNASLPCGARLEEVQQSGRYVVGTFRLTNRPGQTCDAPGQLVRVAFVLRNGKFSEWRQVPDRPGAPVGPKKAEPAPPAIREGQATVAL